MAFEHVIRTQDELVALYDEPSGRTRRTAIAFLDAHCRNFIACSPFVLMATADADGRCDVSPRGGTPGFVLALADNQLSIPDASGNNRLDTVGNILRNAEIGLLFLIPGLSETLRVNGSACITNDPELMALHESQGTPPKAIIGVDVREAYLHCAKAVTRASLWDAAVRPERAGLARPAQVWSDHLDLPAPFEEAAPPLAA